MKKLFCCVIALCALAMAACAVKAPQAAPEAEGPRFAIEKYTEDTVSAEYVKVSGITAQKTLNDNLEAFFLGAFADGAEGSYENTAEFYNIGGRFLSVARIENFMPEGGAYPTAAIAGKTFDLETGEVIGDLVFGGVSPEHPSDVFTQVYPDNAVDAVWERLAANLEEIGPFKDYYLTETAIMAYVNHDLHAEGDYFIFEAPYEQSVSLLSGALAAVVLE
ncbi:MAG: hypothetical protein LBS19_12995 [Clostridiales bacterium]|nr:hypothetical protein [Clostridiales bacterium]